MMVLQRIKSPTRENNSSLEKIAQQVRYGSGWWGFSGWL